MKGNQFENVGKMTATLHRPESVETSWPKLSVLYLEVCAWTNCHPPHSYLGPRPHPIPHILPSPSTLHHILPFG